MGKKKNEQKYKLINIEIVIGYQINIQFLEFIFDIERETHKDI